MSFNPLQNGRIVDWTKLKVYADDKKCNLGTEIHFGMGRKNIVWKKEKMLDSSIFSFSHNVFRCFFFMVVKSHDVWLGRKNIVRKKEKMLDSSIFSFSHNVFRCFFFMVVKSRDVWLSVNRLKIV